MVSDFWVPSSVTLAAASNAVVVGFNVIPDEAARAAIEVRCLKFAEALLVQRQQFDSLDEVLAQARTIRAQREN